MTGKRNSGERINLTVAAIKNLPIPEQGKRKIYYDKDHPKFGIRVTGTGAKSFVLYRSLKGRPLIHTIGKVGDITLTDARDAALAVNGQIAKGEDVRGARRRERGEATLAEYWEGIYWPEQARGKKNGKMLESMFNRHLKRWGRRKLSDIEFGDLQDLHKRVSRKTPVAANRLMALASHLFAQAKRDHRKSGFTGENPARGIARNTEKHRERYLTADEAPRFFEALAAEMEIWFSDFVWLAILTGARKSNILSMRFSEIDFTSKQWTIPADKTKAKETIYLPLHDEAMGLINRRKEETEGDFVFPGKGKAGHVVDVKARWAKFVSRAGLNDFHVHDCRHTIASWQGAAGASEAIIAKSLGHSDPGTAKIYTQLSINPIRRSMGEAIDALLLHDATRPKAEVIKLPGKKSKSGGT